MSYKERPVLICDFCGNPKDVLKDICENCESEKTDDDHNEYLDEFDRG